MIDWMMDGAWDVKFASIHKIGPTDKNSSKQTRGRFMSNPIRRSHIVAVASGASTSTFQKLASVGKKCAKSGSDEASIDFRYYR